MAFLLSGGAALIDEVCWIRRASLVFGSTTHALSSVLAVFFLGLALGSEWAGRRSTRWRSPLRAYAAIEGTLALLVLASLPLFAGVEACYGVAYRAFSDAPALLTLARMGLVAVVLLPPTLLMGATLPLLTRHFVRDDTRLIGRVAGLYSLNTLGAAGGCLLAGLWLLPELGTRAGVGLGATLSLAAAALALASRSRAPAADTVAPAPAVPPARAALLQAVVAVTGFTALGYEVLWTRFLGLVIRNTVLTYTLTLATVLIGIMLGSLLAAAGADRVRARAGLFGLLQIGGALVVPALLLAPPAMWHAIGDRLAVYALLMMPAAVLSGAAFPLGVRLLVSAPERAGAGVGRATALNTLGGIAGSLVTGFLLLPRVGLHASLLVLSGVALAGGVLTLLALERGVRAAPRVALAAGALALWAALPSLLGTRLPADYLRAPRATLVDVREGLVSNAAVHRRDGVLHLEIDRWWQGQSTRTHQIMAAHLPMLLHPSARHAMVVGLGVGQTADRFLMHGVDRLDVVDIEPALFDLVPRHFQAAWPRDPRVRLLSEDGRNVIAHSGDRYDVISIEVGLAFRPGVPAFYTTDFYRRARARLAPGGLLSQFVPLLALPPEVVPGILASFREVFPHALLWYNTSEALLIGVNADTLPVDRDSLARGLARPAVRADLATFRHWGDARFALDRPEVLLSGFLCGERGLAALAGDAPPYRDDRPALDYAATRVLEGRALDLRILAPLRARLDPLAGVVRPPLSADTLALIDRLRAIDLGHMESGALISDVQRRGLTWDDPLTFELIERAASACPWHGAAARLMGQACARRGRRDEAVAWLTRALEIEPGDADAHRELGWTLLDLGRVDEAIARFQAGLARRADDADALNGLGAAFATRGALPAARDCFARALALDPTNAGIRENLQRAEARLRTR